MGYTESWRRGFSMMAAPLTTLHIYIFLVFITLLQNYLDVGVSGGVIFGYLDFDNLPDTNFSCEGKVIGGYYADVETACQMFHVCTIGQNGETTDIKFLCLNGTVFDQETRVCERVDEVDCSNSEAFYDLNLELYGNSAMIRLNANEPKKTEDGTQDKDTVVDWRDSVSGHAVTGSPHSVPDHDATSTPHSILMAASFTTSKIPVMLPASQQHEYLPTSATHSATHEPSFTSHIQKLQNNNNNKYNYTNNFPSTNNSSYFQHSYNGESQNDDTFKKSFSPKIINSSPTFDSKDLDEPAVLLGDNLSKPDFNDQIFSTINPPSGKHDYDDYDEEDGKSDTSEESGNLGHKASTPLLLNNQHVPESNHNNANQNNRNIFTFQSTTILPSNYYNINPNFNSHSDITLNPLYSLRGHAVSNTRYSTPSSFVSQQQANKSVFSILSKAHQSLPSDADVGIMGQNIPSTHNQLHFQLAGTKDDRQQDLRYPPVTIVSISSNFSSSSIVNSNIRSTNQDNSNNGHEEVLGTIKSRGNGLPITNVNGANPKHTGLFANLFQHNVTFENTKQKHPTHTMPPPISYDEYQEQDVQSDPFFRDVPKIPNHYYQSSHNIAMMNKRQANIQ